MKENQIILEITKTILPASAIVVKNVARKVKIAFIEDSFSYSFNDLKEGPLPERVLYGYNLCKEEKDRPLISFLGENVFMTHITDLWEMILQQPNGEFGDLLTDSGANIFYVLDNKKELCAAIAYWTRLGWCLDVHVITDKSRWLIGNRVFSYKKKLA